MASWCRVTITYPATGYTQNYKRDIAVHSHPLAQAFVVAAKTDSVAKINAHLPAGVAAATLATVGQHNLHVYLPANPGIFYRLI